LVNYIPEEKIAEIRSVADIVDVVSEAVALKKAGRNFLGLCPFHSEKTPSFTVSPDKQIFYCFGCGTGGNVFSFLMKQDGVSFPEAVRSLARRFGVALPDHGLTPEQKQRMQEREQLFEINKSAMAYYRQMLEQDAAGRRALNYLSRRGFSADARNEFELGYAPEGWDNLLQHLQRKGLRPQAIEKAGLAVPRKNSSGHYDRFRDRVMFPIIDISGQVIGFGGRVLDDSLPKYLNSPETAVYNKSRSLYGLSAARRHCREEAAVFVVEGYFDAIALYQHGVRNVVATLGTALTADHLRILRGLIGENGRVILVYDSDEAGVNAARRSIAVFDKSFVDAQFLILETGHDPDTYVFKYGPEAFRQSAAGAMGAFSFLLAGAVSRHGLTVEGKIRIIAELEQPLAAVNDSVERAVYLKELAERIGVDEAAIRQRLAVLGPSKAAPGPGRASAGRQTRRPDSGRPAGGKRERMERQVIAMMLQFPESLPEIRRQNALQHIESETLQRIGNAVVDYFIRRGDAESNAPGVSMPGDDRWVAAFISEFGDEDTRRLVSDLAFQEEVWTAEGCRKLIAHFVDTAMQSGTGPDLDGRIREAERRNDHEQVRKLLLQKQNMAVSREKRKMAILNKD
jgi:DNA primase